MDFSECLADCPVSILLMRRIQESLQALLLESRDSETSYMSLKFCRSFIVMDTSCHLLGQKLYEVIAVVYLQARPHDLPILA
jgi:hypothetical protein